MARVKRCSTTRKMSLSAVVHSYVHSPVLRGDSSASKGRTRSLKLGTKGAAHNKRPSTCYSSYNVPGSSAPTQRFRLFFASRYDPRQISIPTKKHLGWRN